MTKQTRHVVGEWVLRGTLVARSPLAVASGEAGSTTDQACARDGLGRLIIPGSALAGIVRPTFEQLPAWGSQALASLLYVEDAVASHSPPVEVRDGVAIDRRTGTAAEHLLYSREVVPVGTSFAWTLRVEAVDRPEGALSKEDAEAWLTQIAHELGRGRELGARTTAGLGRVQLTNATLEWLGTGNREDLLALLSGKAPPAGKVDLSGAASSRLVVTVPWRARSPLLVSVAFNGLADRLPQTAARAVAGSDRVSAEPYLVIPGTSWKGALRSRAEWIVRTVTGEDAPPHLDAQLAQDLGPVGRLFGRPPVKTQQDGEVVRHPGSRGAARLAEVYSTEAIAGWREALAALAVRTKKSDDAETRLGARIKAAQAVAGTGRLRINDHVAISRWTGGADEGKLFATVAPLPDPESADRGGAPTQGSWEPLVVEVDLDRLGTEAEARSAVYLLALLLRDVAEGWVGIGYGSTRGYGEVSAELKDIAFAFPAGSTLAEGSASFTLASFFSDAALRAPFEEAWRSEIATLTPSPASGGDR
jgi:CRISPR/Cas system CSM-associated protein Csm3 (group 7 of RAMP superfamily)